MRTRPLPEETKQFLTEHTLSIKKLHDAVHGEEAEAISSSGGDEEGPRIATEETKLLSLEEFKESLKKTFEKVPVAERDKWINAVDSIIAFGPKRVGSNLLIDLTGQFKSL